MANPNCVCGGRSNGLAISCPFFFQFFLSMFHTVKSVTKSFTMASLWKLIAFVDSIADQSHNAAWHDVDSQALFPLVLGERAIVKKQVKANEYCISIHSDSGEKSGQKKKSHPCTKRKAKFIKILQSNENYY